MNRTPRKLWPAIAAVASLPLALDAAPARLEVTTALDRILTAEAEQAITAKLPTASEIKVGQPLEIELRSKQAGYVSLIYVDSHGVLEIIRPAIGSAGNFLKADLDAVYVGSDDQPWRARPPAGPAAVYVIVTDKQVTSIAAEGSSVGGHFISAVDAPRTVKRVIEELGGGNHYAVKLEMDVRGAEYTASDIIQYFEITRSIDKPKLDVNINFDFNKADVLPSSIKSLETWGRVLSDPLMSGQKFVIGGHTDDVGSKEYNYELSVRRAEAVRDYLVGRFGIDARRLEVRGYGDKNPLIDRPDDDSRARNRRVEFERASRMAP